jgi:hypothetical protein
MMAYIVQAIGGAVGGNILGALTRGGGGIAGRTIIGALGGVGLGYAAGAVPAIGNIAANWSGLIDGEHAVDAANLITGLIGGGVLGLIGGLLIRPRN